MQWLTDPHSPYWQGVSFLAALLVMVVALLMSVRPRSGTPKSKAI
jgi:hypothetical protein